MSSSASRSSTMEADTKISNDLVVLKEKMDLLENMLDPPDAASPKLSVKTNETMKSAIGYLDACGPRMIELVTACTSTRLGVLSEEIFGEVLGCNDRLQKLLTDVDTRMLTETTASTTVAASASEEAANKTEVAADLTEQFGDLLLVNEDPFAKAQGGAAGAKTTGETSEDSDLFASPAPPVSGDAKDPFDDFFAERTDSKF